MKIFYLFQPLKTSCVTNLRLKPKPFNFKSIYFSSAQRQFGLKLNYSKYASENVVSSVYIRTNFNNFSTGLHCHLVDEVSTALYQFFRPRIIKPKETSKKIIIVIEIITIIIVIIINVI